MGRFKNTQYVDTINSVVTTTKEILNNPYYCWTDKPPTIVDYLSIDTKRTTLDRGSLIEYNSYGDDSPIRYNLIKDFAIYGIEQIQIAIVNEEFGIQADTVSGEAFVLPNTIVPCSGDYFVINHIKEQYVFKVTEVSYDTLDNGSNMYKLSYELSPDPKEEVFKCIANKYSFVIENVGSNFDCVIRDSILDNLKLIDETIDNLRDYFVTLFYNEKVQTFCYRFLENNFYDPYMIEFLMRNNIISYSGNDYVYIRHMTKLQNIFRLKYNNTFFRAIEKKDKDVYKYENKGMGVYLKDRMSTFYNRPETYFEINYDGLTKDWGIIPTFFDEFYANMGSGKLFDESDGNFYIYNVIIKYFNDQKIDTVDIELLRNFDFRYHHMLFYAIPAVIYCLNKYMDSMMKKE